MYYIKEYECLERGMKMKKSVGEKAILKLAKEKNLSVEEIRKEIQIVIDTGMASDNPEAKAQWAKMCHNGNPPTPEEVITYLSKEVKKELKK